MQYNNKITVTAHRLGKLQQILHANFYSKKRKVFGLLNFVPIQKTASLLKQAKPRK